jgi:tetratricopeptide (TPR) repeat protein
VSGYFAGGADAQYLALAMEPGADPSLSFQIVLHEYTHYFLHRNFTALPAWLNEGLAEFYGSLAGTPRDSRRYLGRPLAHRMAVLRERPLLPLRQIVTNEGAGKYMRDEHLVGMFYAQSWALVHYLTLGHEGRRVGQLGAYIKALQTPGTRADPFTSAFGDPEQLADELQSYVKRYQWPVLELLGASRPAVADATRARQLLESEAERFQADLLVRMGALDEADELLTRAVKQFPDDARLRASRGRLRLAQDRPAEAADLLSEAVASLPDDFSARYHLALALWDANRWDDSLREYEAAARINDQSADAWLGVSSAAAATGRAALAASAMQMALRRRPDPQLFYSRAYMWWRLGRFAEVVSDVRTYLELAGLGDESAQYAAIMAALASWRVGQSSVGETLLNDARAAATPASWTLTVLDFLQNRLPPDRFLSQARGRGQQTEAHAYIGFTALQAGRRDEALTHFRWVRDRGDRGYTEYRLAVAELARLEPTSPKSSR